MAERRHRVHLPSGGRRVAILIVAIVVVGGGITAGVIVSKRSSGSVTGSTTTTTTVPGGSTTTPTSTSPPVPLRVISLSPSNGDLAVKGTAHIEVTLSAPLSPSSPKPELSPPEPGTWTASGSRSVVFVPAMPYLPLTQVRLVVPAGASGVRGTDGARLARRVVDVFKIVDGSTTRLQQLLSLLDYSPLAFRASGPSIGNANTAAQRQALFAPPAGTFTWRNRGWPSQLVGMWQAGAYGVMTKGLVMEFEADHEVATDGQTSTALWQALLSALAAGQVNSGGYNYALANQTQPESLTIWHDGLVVVHVPANTGIAQAPTVDGNFNVFARFRNQVMRGKNPDGSTYADPVQYVAYFNGGDAVHYIPRASYGIPQSLGCVELDLADAAKAWPYLAYGTIVSVVS